MIVQITTCIDVPRSSSRIPRIFYSLFFYNRIAMWFEVPVSTTEILRILLFSALKNWITRNSFNFGDYTRIIPLPPCWIPTIPPGRSTDILYMCGCFLILSLQISLYWKKRTEHFITWLFSTVWMYISKIPYNYSIIEPLMHICFLAFKVNLANFYAPLPVKFGFWNKDSTKNS